MGDATKNDSRASDDGKPRLHLAEADVGAPRPGDVFAGKYTIKRLLGHGGMGNVYLASVGPGEPDIALKMLADRWLDDADAIARFEREASHLSSIEHPNIVALHDSGVERGRPYLTMEYIDGEPLSEYLARKGPLSLVEFVPIAAQMLKGMGYAHLREMMIRDIKPSNIMLCTRKGRANFVKILDFGLAKLTSGEAPLTEGDVLGTAGYLAPEAIRGEPLDLRVDVYAIGVAFYHMLSGVLPFGHQEGAAVLYKTLDESPRPLGEVRGAAADELPRELLKLVDDCLAKDRNDRPDDANIVVERLIDAVPVSYFRLPSVASASRAPGVGNTGLMELVRANPSVEMSKDSSAELESEPKRRRVKEWSLIAVIACLASIGTALAVAAVQGDDETPSVVVLPPDGDGAVQKTPAAQSPIQGPGTQGAGPANAAQAGPASVPAGSAAVPSSDSQPGPSDDADPAAPPELARRTPSKSRASKRRRAARPAAPPADGPPASSADTVEPNTTTPVAASTPPPAALRPAAAPAPERESGGVFLSAMRSDAKADQTKRAKRGLLKASKSK